MHSWQTQLHKHQQSQWRLSTANSTSGQTSAFQVFRAKKSVQSLKMKAGCIHTIIMCDIREILRQKTAWSLQITSKKIYFPDPQKEVNIITEAFSTLVMSKSSFCSTKVCLHLIFSYKAVRSTFIISQYDQF